MREDEAIDAAGVAARNNGRRFVAFIFRFRMLGASLSFLNIAVVLHELAAPAWQWLALVANALLWPPLAWWIATHSRQPRQTELRNLGLDSVFGGAWIALMHFSLLPSAVLLSILSMDKIAVGSWRLMRRMSLLLVLSCLLVGLMEGFHLRLETSSAMVLASLPFLFIYPSAIAAVTHALSRRVVQQNRLLESLNRTDPLTGLPNRMHWQDAAHIELRRCWRRPQSAALLMMDLDGFKGINDRCGHQVGDAVIRRFADILRANCRDTDTPGRYGGEEFGLVLAGADAATAVRVAERIREAFAASAFEDEHSLRCTVSVGVCALDPGIDSVEAWVRAADAALYRAKQAGRNRVELVAGQA